MCGICGQYNFGSSEPVRRSDIEAMTERMVHRGPDDEGYYIAGPLGLGFRRLSIIDLAGGHQPMSDEEESVWVVFNGEIYNFLELREELESSRTCVPDEVATPKSSSTGISSGARKYSTASTECSGSRSGTLAEASSGSGARSVRNQADLLPDRPAAGCTSDRRCARFAPP